ncbi:hypothetical protein DFY02_09310 [Escherichia coli]|nr:hypothetical protein [Escherichia coli]
MTDLGGKTCIFSHPVYLFLREFSLQDSRGGSVFIVLTCNIVTGIMLGFVTLVVGRVFAREWQKLNIGTVIITAALVAFYAGGWAI